MKVHERYLDDHENKIIHHKDAKCIHRETNHLTFLNFFCKTVTFELRCLNVRTHRMCKASKSD